MPADPSLAVYYVSGTAASIAAVLAGARSYYNRQRKRWTDEGVRSQRNAEALEANTKAAGANTDAIGRLTGKLDQFADETRATLHHHDTRIGRLEDMAENQLGRLSRPRDPSHRDGGV
jgi:hypothetical protein